MIKHINLIFHEVCPRPNQRGQSYSMKALKPMNRSKTPEPDASGSEDSTPIKHKMVCRIVLQRIPLMGILSMKRKTAIVTLKIVSQIRKPVNVSSGNFRISWKRTMGRTIWSRQETSNRLGERLPRAKYSSGTYDHDQYGNNSSIQNDRGERRQRKTCHPQGTSKR